MNAFRTVVLAALLLPTTLRAVAAGPLDRVRDSFVRVSALSYAPDEEITDRFIRYSDYGRANDVLLLQLYMSVHLPDAEVRRLLGLFDAGGFWRDIDYADRTRGRWQPSLHLTRMYGLAIPPPHGTAMRRSDAYFMEGLHTGMRRSRRR